MTPPPAATICSTTPSPANSRSTSDNLPPFTGGVPAKPARGTTGTICSFSPTGGEGQGGDADPFSCPLSPGSSGDDGLLSYADLDTASRPNHLLTRPKRWCRHS